jgi:hypothetical protein
MIGPFPPEQIGLCCHFGFETVAIAPPLASCSEPFVAFVCKA